MSRYLARHRSGVVRVAGAVVLLLQIGVSAGLALQLHLASRPRDGRPLVAAAPIASGEGTPRRRPGHAHDGSQSPAPRAPQQPQPALEASR